MRKCIWVFLKQIIAFPKTMVWKFNHLSFIQRLYSELCRQLIADTQQQWITCNDTFRIKDLKAQLYHQPKNNNGSLNCLPMSRRKYTLDLLSPVQHPLSLVQNTCGQTLSQLLNEPRTPHMVALLRVLIYLKLCPSQGLYFYTKAFCATDSQVFQMITQCL